MKNTNTHLGSKINKLSIHPLDSSSATKKRLENYRNNKFSNRFFHSMAFLQTDLKSHSEAFHWHSFEKEKAFLHSVHSLMFILMLWVVTRISPKKVKLLKARCQKFQPQSLHSCHENHVFIVLSSSGMYKRFTALMSQLLRHGKFHQKRKIDSGISTTFRFVLWRIHIDKQVENQS